MRSDTGATDRVAATLLFGHLLLIVFSTVALTTFLNGPPAPWLQEEPNRTIMRWGWTLSGPTYVVLGALAALVHAAGRVGVSRALAILVIASTIALGAELLGTSTGVPFGPYRYTPLLGFMILDLVPFPIPISWFYMIYCALAICGRVLPARDDVRTRLRWALVGGAVLTAWDVSMDPAMVKTSHWIWSVDGFFYGMPFSNWVGWYLTGTVISYVLLAIVPPSAFASRVSPSTLPLVLYASNGIMPIALCIREHLWWAAVLGTLAMAWPLSRAVRSGVPTGVTDRAARAREDALDAVPG